MSGRLLAGIHLRWFADPFRRGKHGKRGMQTCISMEDALTSRGIPAGVYPRGGGNDMVFVIGVIPVTVS